MPLTFARSPPDLALRLGPFFLMALAGLAVRTPWMAEHPRLAAALFLWIAMDSLASAQVLAMRGQGRVVAARAALAGMALGAVAAVAGMTPPLRTILVDMPWAVAALALLVGAHVAWGLMGARAAWAGAGGDRKARITAALSCLIPQPLARLVVAEVSLLHLALFRWGGAPDVPAGHQAHTCHRELYPLLGGFIAVQVMEMAVTDVVVGLHHRTAATALFVLGDLALVYTLGLMKSLRQRPVLLGPRAVRVRFGLLVDRTIPYADIQAVRVAADAVPKRSPANLSRLVAPNVVLTLRRPLTCRRFLRAEVRTTMVGLYVDEPAAFVRALDWRTAQETT